MRPSSVALRPRGAARAKRRPRPSPRDAKARKRAPRAKGVAHEGRLSGLDAAAEVPEEAGEAPSCTAIVERALEKGYWKTDSKTPAATIYAAIQPSQPRLLRRSRLLQEI